MDWINHLKLLRKIIFMKEFVWPKLPESAFVKGRLATSEDYFSGNASFFSVPVEDPNLPANDISIPQYALHIKSMGLKIPCIIIQAEGKNNAYLIGYKNLLNGENCVGWGNEFKFLGRTSLSKKEW